MNAVTKLPSRKDLLADAQEQAAFYLRDFDPKRYITYYQRIYDATAYLEDIGIHKLCELIEHGNNILMLAKKLDISGATLRRFLNSRKEYAALSREAFIYAGEMFAYKAEQVLLNAPNDKLEMSRAEKLAAHYRWMAERLAREMFGEVKEDKNANRPPAVINLNLVGGVVPEALKDVTPKTKLPDFMKLTEPSDAD